VLFSDVKNELLTTSTKSLLPKKLIETGNMVSGQIADYLGFLADKSGFVNGNSYTPKMSLAK
jgi:hypothetical protein